MGAKGGGGMGGRGRRDGRTFTTSTPYVPNPGPRFATVAGANASEMVNWGARARTRKERRRISGPSLRKGWKGGKV